MRGVLVIVGRTSLTVRRTVDGRTRVIRAGGPIVEAEPTDAGLLYAYNVRGRNAVSEALKARRAEMNMAGDR